MNAYFKRKLLFSITTILALSGTQSCDSDYDLSKDINTDINVGGCLYVPVGETDTLTLSRIIDLNDEIGIDENGNYCITESGSISINAPFVKTIIIDDISIKPTLVDVEAGQEGSFVPMEYTINDDIEYDMKINSSIDIPVEVNELHSVEIVPLDAELNFHLTFKDQATASKLTDVKINHLSIDFPDIIVFDENTPNFNNSTNTLTIDNPITATELNKVSLRIIGIKNLPGIVNNTITLKDVVHCKGNITATAKNATGDELSSMQIETSFDVPNIEIKKITGKINPEIKVDAQDITFNDLPELLKDKDTKIELNRLYSKISIENPSGIPFITNLNFKAFDESGNQINKEVDAAFNIAKALDYSTPVTSQFILTNTDDIVVPDGYTKVVNPELTQIIETVPHSVKISPSVVIDQNQDHFYELGVEKSTSAEYKVRIPFDFGINSQIAYVESFNNIQKDISDIIDLIEEVQLDLDIQNMLPLDLVVNVTPYDISGKEMTDRVYIDSDIAISGFKQSAKVESKIINIKEIVPGALTEVDRLDINIKGKGSMDRITLNPSQYILISLKAKLPKGITID